LPTITTTDHTKLYYEDTGQGIPLIFVHEFAGDQRSFALQIRFFARSYRCIAFAARGYLPSDVPDEPGAYSQEKARADVVSIMDGLEVDKAHIIGHSMGAYTALHVAIQNPERCRSVAAIGCGWGSNPDEREQSQAQCTEISDMFRNDPIKDAAAQYARFPMRNTFEAKDPLGFAEFEKALAEHSSIGSALTMSQLQRQRPTLWEMEPQLSELEVPLLVIVGDEDEPCLDGSLFLKRTVRTAALAVIPRSSHTLPLEEPAAINAVLADLFAAVEQGSWMTHRMDKR